MARSFTVLDDIDVKGKKVVLRMDLNVPMQGGVVRDMTRILRQIPTLRELAEKDAKVIVLSHFGRPKGYDPDLSLSPLVDVLSDALQRPVRFGLDCVGKDAQDATAEMQNGDIVLLENLRFHAEEEKNDKAFAAGLASLGSIFVNDAFSCSHRAHASVVGVADYLPAVAGRLMQAELDALERLFHTPRRPLGAMVGGSKVSTKLGILGHLIDRLDMIIIGGAMAHTFLAAQGFSVGASLYEPDLIPTAKAIMSRAAEQGCEIILPKDVVVTKKFAPHAPNRVVAIDQIQEDDLALDVGTDGLLEMIAAVKRCQMLLWNGPLGAFETAPFDAGTVMLARVVAAQTASGKLHSVAGGGDTVAALSHAGLFDEFSYLSTAGGAFLEWMEGKPLPGVARLMAAKKAAA
jgi:phosphoglycerate kinase